MSRLSQQLGADKNHIDPYTGQPLGPIVSTITIQNTEGQGISQAYTQHPPSARTVGYPPDTQEHTVVHPVVYQEGAPAPPLGEKTDYRPSDMVMAPKVSLLVPLDHQDLDTLAVVDLLDHLDPLDLHHLILLLDLLAHLVDNLPLVHQEDSHLLALHLHHLEDLDPSMYLDLVAHQAHKDLKAHKAHKDLLVPLEPLALLVLLVLLELLDPLVEEYLNFEDETPTQYIMCKKDLLKYAFNFDDAQLIDAILSGAPTAWHVMIQAGDEQSWPAFSKRIKDHEDEANAWSA
ncbi:hypothetical protein FRC11_011914 [Ceratobasidium sp. 423]|nr:hypothetical protein FRC11_011914 [Ceratobasidium sp. 423]